MHLTKTITWMSQSWLPKTAGITGYILGSSGGRFRIVIGVWPLIKNLIPADIFTEILDELSSATSFNLNDVAIAKIDPLGYSLSVNSILDSEWNNAVKAFVSKSDPLKILNTITYNPVFLDLILETLLIQALTCVDNKINGTRPIGRPSVVGRLHHQRYHLAADRYPSIDDYEQLRRHSNPAVVRFSVRLESNGSPNQRFASLRLAALARSIILGKTPHTVLTASWWDPEVPARGSSIRTHGDALKNLGKAPRATRYAAMSELLSLPDGVILESTGVQEVNITDNAAAISTRREKQYRAVQGQIISRVPKAHRPGRDVILEFWKDAATEAEQNLGAAVVAGMISGGLDPLHWRDALVIQEEKSVLIGTQMRHPTGEAYVDQNIHIPTYNLFWRFVPKCLAVVIERHRKASVEEMKASGNRWLQLRNGSMTLSRLRETLLWRFPLEVDVQSIFWRLGLDSDPKKLGGDRSYINWHPLDTLDSMMPFYRLLDSNFEPFNHEVSACGSPFTPSLEMLRSLFSKQREYIKNIPKYEASAELILERANLIAAVGRFAEALLSFTRNRDAFVPLKISVSGKQYFCPERFRIICEKEWPRIVTFSKVLRDHAIIVREALDRHLNLLRLKGLSPPFPECITKGLYFLRIQEGVVSVLPPSRRQMLDAMESCDEMASFIGLHRNAARHAGNTYLRNLGYPEPAILGLMDHFAARTRSPLSVFSMRVAVQMESAQVAGEMLAKIFGIIH